MRFVSKFTEEIHQRFCILRGAEIAADTVLHCLMAAGDIAGDEGAASGGTLQQNVGHALMVGGQHNTVRCLVERMHVRLEAVEVDDTVIDQLIDSFLVGILVETHHIKGDLFAKLRLDGFRGSKELVHTLFLHDSPYKQETAHAVILHGDIGILVQIDASAGEHLHLSGGDDVFM